MAPTGNVSPSHVVLAENFCCCLDSRIQGFKQKKQNFLSGMKDGRNPTSYRPRGVLEAGGSPQPFWQGRTENPDLNPTFWRFLVGSYQKWHVENAP